VTWFKLDDGWWSHRKVLPVSLEARGLWITAACWSSQHLTDGVIDMATLRAITGVSEKTLRRCSDELAKQGLWNVRAESVRIHDWEKYQFTREQVEAKRAAERERKSRVRAESERNPAGRRAESGGRPRLPSRPVPSNTPQTPQPPPFAQAMARLEEATMIDPAETETPF